MRYGTKILQLLSCACPQVNSTGKVHQEPWVVNNVKGPGIFISSLRQTGLQGSPYQTATSGCLGNLTLARRPPSGLGARLTSPP